MTYNFIFNVRMHIPDFGTVLSTCVSTLFCYQILIHHTKAQRSVYNHPHDMTYNFIFSVRLHIPDFGRVLLLVSLLCSVTRS